MTEAIFPGGMLVFPDLTEFDRTGPHEILATAGIGVALCAAAEIAGRQYGRAERVADAATAMGDRY